MSTADDAGQLADPGAAPVWDSGVGGAQCDDCGEFTIVRWFGGWEDDDEQWLCRACAEGWHDDEMDGES